MDGSGMDFGTTDRNRLGAAASRFSRFAAVAAMMFAVLPATPATADDLWIEGPPVEGPGLAPPALPPPVTRVRPFRRFPGVASPIDLATQGTLLAGGRPCAPGFAPETDEVCTRHGVLRTACDPNTGLCEPLVPDPIPYGPGAYLRKAY